MTKITEVVESTEDESKVMQKYQKKVLKKVSFSENLVNKELAKAKKWLNIEHFEELLDWAVKEFSALAEKIKSWFKDVFIKKQVCPV